MKRFSLVQVCYFLLGAFALGIFVSSAVGIIEWGPIRLLTLGITALPLVIVIWVSKNPRQARHA